MITPVFSFEYISKKLQNMNGIIYKNLSSSPKHELLKPKKDFKFCDIIDITETEDKTSENEYSNLSSWNDISISSSQEICIQIEVDLKWLKYQKKYGTLNLEGNLKNAEKKAEFNEIILHFPSNSRFNRIPGEYGDLNSKYKRKHNNLILKYSKILIEENLTALLLDGIKMRTSTTLMRSYDKVRAIHIVEINATYFNKMKRKMKELKMDYKKVQIYHAHVMDYILRGIDPRTNLVYLDTMCNFFDSPLSKGTNAIINQLLKQLIAPKIIFASTFCLRTTTAGFAYEEQVLIILENLHYLFEKNDFKFKTLIPRKEMRYQGQKLKGKGMMFVLYFLEKDNNITKLNENSINIII